MINLEWAHVILAASSALIGAAIGLVGGSYRVGKIEAGLEMSIKDGITASERKFEEKVDRATEQFDETLKGLRQKINDVELDAYKLFVAKPDFEDFRKEYREDMRDLKHSISNIPKAKQ